MLLSSRADPPKALRNLSSSRTNLAVRQLLVSSPLPSPALPALIPRHGKRPPNIAQRRALRLVIQLCIIITTYYLILHALRWDVGSSFEAIPYLSSNGKSYEIVGDVELPQDPTPFSITDRKGHSWWTVFIPQQLDFPLPSSQYAEMCSHVKEVARHAGDRGSNNNNNNNNHHHHNHQHLVQPYSHYMEVDRAQAAGLLPQQIHIAEPDQGQDKALPICEKSLTFVLDSTDAGLGSTLLGLWISYGLAQKEDRAFFMDDSQFAYGKFESYFDPPPKPKCRAAPKTQRVPCPQQAKHLVVSPATYPWIYGSAFSSQYSEREIFDLARSGYEALFKLERNDNDIVLRRIADLRAPSPTLLVGVHLRRGDRHPFEFAYSQGYLPPSRYKDAAEKLAGAAGSRSKIVMASDDPDIYLLDDFSGYARAQELLILASKHTSADISSGWEGGFFKDQFWPLGLPDEVFEQKKHGSPQPNRQRPEARAAEGKAAGAGAGAGAGTGTGTDSKGIQDYRSHPTEEARRLRELIGRAYLMDITVLSHTDRVVCAVSSYACRILAVMMGWERAMEQGHWNNIDGKYGWRALDV